MRCRDVVQVRQVEGSRDHQQSASMPLTHLTDGRRKWLSRGAHIVREGELVNVADATKAFTHEIDRLRPLAQT